MKPRKKSTVRDGKAPMTRFGSFSNGAKCPRDGSPVGEGGPSPWELSKPWQRKKLELRQPRWYIHIQYTYIHISCTKYLQYVLVIGLWKNVFLGPVAGLQGFRCATHTMSSDDVAASLAVLQWSPVSVVAASRVSCRVTWPNGELSLPALWKFMAKNKSCYMADIAFCCN